MFRDPGNRTEAGAALRPNAAGRIGRLRLAVEHDDPGILRNSGLPERAQRPGRQAVVLEAAAPALRPEGHLADRSRQIGLLVRPAADDPLRHRRRTARRTGRCAPASKRKTEELPMPRPRWVQFSMMQNAPGCVNRQSMLATMTRSRSRNSTGPPRSSSSGERHDSLRQPECGWRIGQLDRRQGTAFDLGPDAGRIVGQADEAVRQREVARDHREQPVDVVRLHSDRPIACRARRAARGARVRSGGLTAVEAVQGAHRNGEHGDVGSRAGCRSPPAPAASARSRRPRLPAIAARAPRSHRPAPCPARRRASPAGCA